MSERCHAKTESNVVTIDNYISGTFVPPSTKEYMNVHNPADGAVIAKVALSNETDVDKAVAAAQTAFASWSKLTIKTRAAIMLKFHALVQEHANELAQLIVKENGKNITEALADVAKGNETVEYACSLPQLAAGRLMQVSSGGVYCRDDRRPLGVVASIVPFNFPFMVPMWTLPIALVMGNCVVLKPSEKVPLTMHRAMQLLTQAGVPSGVVQLVQGAAAPVQALMRHPNVKAVTFVGSSPVARIIKEECNRLHKRCIALGGAKNHLVALSDCDVSTAASDITVSFAGCAGQRCMAASVLLHVNDGSNGNETEPSLIQAIVDCATKIKPGSGPGEMGPVIDEASYMKIHRYIKDAVENDGAELLLDGRSWEQPGNGHWIGPTIILHSSSKDKTMKEEVFGPVLSIYNCKSWEEAVEIENANPFGNAASIYTSCGAHADWFTDRFRAGMLGINIGIPVPREPFSFGGRYDTMSKYGDSDITGDGGIEFFSHRVKITSKWPMAKRKADQMDSHGKDAANFAGTM
ncbi:hypothetical protein MPSEU_000785000 [Mayamaea pseudoterrestris]|nr:hypothetical protein MPSEU_000785000 [Mayamaea pseudoterrestris]